MRMIINKLAETGHDHADESMSFWDEVVSITFDPAHIAGEVFWQLVFDVVLVAFLYGVVFKKWLLPKLRKQLHTELDNEHGIEHHDDHIHIKGAKDHD
jgi:hypothetical protein